MSTIASSRLAPYLPRLARAWAERIDGPCAEFDASLVSVDISGFTALSERLAAKGRSGAEELILLISGLYEGLIRIAERRGGDVLKFRGDALLILFDGAEHELRACVAADEMQFLIETIGRTRSSVGAVELGMSVGVYSGPSQFFLVGHSHRELVVAGPAATATIALEDAASAAQILVSPRTAEAVDPSWIAERRDGGVLLERGLADAQAHAHVAELRDEELPDDALDSLVPAPLLRLLTVGPAEAEHRLATVAFVKFTGVAEIYENAGLEELGSRIATLGDVVGAAADELGITWLESDIDLDGGKLYLTAGAPATPGGDEERMLRALRSIVDEDCGLTVRAGVNRGNVFAGEIGAASRRTYAVMGDTVNLAARLAGRAKPGQILSTGDVLERSTTVFEGDAQPFLVKGKQRAITAYSVGGAVGQREERALERLPLVGRDGELATFREAVEAARLRSSRLIELAGEPGIGKSRLVEELCGLAIGFTQLVARCEPYATAAPYFVYRPLLRQLVGILPGASSEEAGAQLTAWTQAVMPDQAPWLPLLAIPFDATVESSPESDAIDPAFRRPQLHNVLEQFLSRVLLMPTLFVFEDAHWMDDASRELLHHLTAHAAPRAWLVCVTRRLADAGFVAADGSNGLLLELSPLAGDAASTLALSSTSDVSLSDVELTAIVARAGGNPLFVRELVAAARTGELPETVERLMTERIDTLEADDRMLLRYASVVGARFDLELMREILADELEGVGDLERWDRVSEFIERSGDDVLQFRHDLFRTAAYEGLSFKRRREIHERVGAALERRAGERTDEAAGLLSLHFLEAGEAGKAWTYSVAAGRRAQERYANVDAAEFYHRALRAAEQLETPELTEVAAVAESLGDVCELAAHYSEAEEAYRQARSLVGDHIVPVTRLLRKEGVLLERRGRYDEALDWFQRALDLLGEAADPEGLRNRIALEHDYAVVLYRQARFEEAERWAERAAEHADQAGDRRGLANAYRMLNTAHHRRGGRETDWFERALPIYEEIGDRVGKAIVLNSLGISYYFSGRWHEAMSYYEQSAEATRAAGEPIRSATRSNNVAEILLDQGRHDRATELLKEAIRVYEASGYLFGAAVAKKNLARSAAAEGRFAEAHSLFGEAIAELERIGSGEFLVEAKARRAECFVLEGRYTEARELASDTLEHAERIEERGPRASHLERLLGYALVQARLPDEARPHFEESLRAGREGGFEYEVALTLKALADTSLDPAAQTEAEEILTRLGVVATPHIPLP
jgi:class 3 adenylate cyclase/tetratricopeptide (TPR) repeat protein